MQAFDGVSENITLILALASLQEGWACCASESRPRAPSLAFLQGLF